MVQAPNLESEVYIRTHFGEKSNNCESSGSSFSNNSGVQVNMEGQKKGNNIFVKFIPLPLKDNHN